MSAAGGGRRTALALGGWLALVYALGTGGHVYSPDGVLRGRTTESLVERGSLAIDGRRVPPGFLATGRGGELYAKYDVGLSLAAVPFYLAGRTLAAAVPPATAELFAGPRFLWYDPRDSGDDWRFFGLGLTNAVLVAAVAALLYALALAVGYPPPAALGVALVAAFASPLWVYSKDLFAEPLAALGLVGFALAAERAARPRAPRGGVPAAFAAGAALGLANAAKLAHVVLLPLAIVLFALRLRRAGRDAAARPRLAPRLAALLGGLAPLLAIVAISNLARFGGFGASGYGDELRLWTTPPLVGLAGLSLSAGRGLLPYFPFVLVAAAATPAAYRRAPEWTLFGWGGLATLLALYCRWHGWDGGWAWGPRFLVPVVPLVALAGAPLFTDRPRGWRRAGWVVLGLSFAIALSGTLVATTDFHQALREAYGGGRYLEVARWSWRHYAPVAAWRLAPGSYFLFPRALAHPSGWWLAALFAAGGVAALGWGRGWLPRAAGRAPRGGRPAPWLIAAAAAALLAALASRLA